MVASGDFATSRSQRKRCTGSRAAQRLEPNSMIAVVYQRPLRGALIAQPVMFDLPLRLARANEGWGNGFSRFRQAVGFYKKQLAFSEFEKWFRTSRIGALTEHVSHSTATPKIDLWAHNRIPLSEHFACHLGFSTALPTFAAAQRVLQATIRCLLPPNRQRVPTHRRGHLPPPHLTATIFT